MSEARKAWMSVLSKSPPDQLAEAVETLGSMPEHTWLRAPEIGTVMVRGRQGAEGAAFNLGEMTVTRCALRLRDGTVGHAYVPGRDADHAKRAALCDAMMQGPEASQVETHVISPLRSALEDARNAQSAKAAATKVDFFTMVRGEG